MSALYMFLLKNIEGTKGISSEYQTKDGIKRTAKKNREDFIVCQKPLAVLVKG